MEEEEGPPRGSAKAIAAAVRYQTTLQVPFSDSYAWAHGRKRAEAPIPRQASAPGGSQQSAASAAFSPSPSPATGPAAATPSPSGLTDEQRVRIERNRRQATERLAAKRKREEEERQMVPPTQNQHPPTSSDVPLLRRAPTRHSRDDAFLRSLGLEGSPEEELAELGVPERRASHSGAGPTAPAFQEGGLATPSHRPRPRMSLPTPGHPREVHDSLWSHQRGAPSPAVGRLSLGGRRRSGGSEELDPPQRRASSGGVAPSHEGGLATPARPRAGPAPVTQPHQGRQEELHSDRPHPHPHPPPSGESQARAATGGAARPDHGARASWARGPGPPPARAMSSAGGVGGGGGRKPPGGGAGSVLLRKLEAEDGGEEASEQHRRYPWMEPERRRDADGRRPGEPGYNPNTLYIPETAFGRMTPFERSFWKIKRLHMDLVLFVRAGSFYNLFDVDADVGMDVGLKLSGKLKANLWKVGCNAPVFDRWMERVLALGLCVGRVEQVVAPAGAKESRDVARKLVRTYTPSTWDWSGTGGPSTDPVLLAVVEDGNAKGVCLVEPTAGTVSVGQFVDDMGHSGLQTTLAQYGPAETVYVTSGRYKLGAGALQAVRASRAAAGFPGRMAVEPLGDPPRPAPPHASLAQLEGAYFPEGAPGALRCFEGAESPLGLEAFRVAAERLQEAGLDRDLLPAASVGLFSPSVDPDRLVMDAAALGALSVLEGPLGGTEGSLLGLLDRTVTRMGARTLRRWLARPLLSCRAIRDRQDAVGALAREGALREVLLAGFRGAPDLERLLIKTHAMVQRWGRWDAEGGGGDEEVTTSPFGSTASNPVAEGREALATVGKLCGAAGALVGALSSLGGAHRKATEGSRALEGAVEAAARAARPLARLQGAVVPGPDGSLRPAQGMFAGYDAACRQVDAAEARLQDAVEDLVERMGLPPGRAALRRPDSGGGNWELELPASAMPAGELPPEVEVVPGGKKGVRWLATARLRALSAARADAGEEERESAAAVARELLVEVTRGATVWAQLGTAAAEVEVLCSLASSATSMRMHGPVSRPVLVGEGGDEGGDLLDATPLLELKDAWCPLLGREVQPVGNDVTLGGEGASALLLRGPNMGGKSTLLRTVGVATVLAQVGAMVPCGAMRLAPADRVFCRVGASDELAMGMSTFHVEMAEACAILRNATCSSVVLADELGRGTSTHDGYAVAYAVLHALSRRTGCRSMFATHHGGLSEEPSLQRDVASAHMEARTGPGGAFTPLFRLRPGPPPHGSCGVQVAHLAGLDGELLHVAVRRSEWLKERHAGRRRRVENAGDNNEAGGGMEDGMEVPPLSGDEEGLLARLHQDPLVADVPGAVGDSTWAAGFYDLWQRCGRLQQSKQSGMEKCSRVEGG